MLKEELSLATARDALDASSAPVRGLLNLVSERAPIAWLLQESSGVPLPLVVSMQGAGTRPRCHPRGDLVRRPRGRRGRSFDRGEHLGGRGTEVETIRSAEYGVRRFVERYEASPADVLWITSHEFGHYDFRETTLRLAADEELPLDFVAQLRPPVGDRRRLLVVNSCDGATTAGVGGPSLLGIGALAAGAHQAVVSHGWPVGFKEGVVFGALLAVGLSHRHGFVAAYAFVIDTLVGG